MTLTVEAPVPIFDDEATDGNWRSSARRAPSTWRIPAWSWPTPPWVKVIETHMFFTFWGFDIINKETMGHLPVHPGGQPGHAHAADADGSTRDDGFRHPHDEEADRGYRRP